jgi:glucose/arabinose dehydrogenase
MRRHLHGGLRVLPARLLVLVGACGVLGIGIWTDVQSAAGKPANSARAFAARLVKVASGFHFPTYLTGTPADPKAYYVAERAGAIQIVRNGRRLPKAFLDISSQISIAPTSEQGLLSMAFDPSYATNHAFYVDYTDHGGNIVVAQFHRASHDPNRADASSQKIIMKIGHPGTGKHYAGQLQFGPHNHYLYISTGDGGVMAGGNGTAQQLNSLLGKILRIDVHRHSRHHLYRIPKGNPFVHRSGALPQIYAYGLRNPFRFSFDAKTGGVWIGDVGENTWEEIDYRKATRFAGTNFGWPRFEGPAFFRNIPASHPVPPVISKHHYGAAPHEHWCAVIGGDVEYDPTIPKLARHYLFADHCSGEVDVARISRRGKAFGVVPTGIQVGKLVNSFGIDGSQHLYLAAEDGTIYRFVKK